MPLLTPPTPIIVALVIYPLSFPGTSGALLVFNRYNITIFLKKFKSIYNNINLKIKTKVKRVLEYYKDNIAKEVKGYNI